MGGVKLTVVKFDSRTKPGEKNASPGEQLPGVDGDVISNSLRMPPRKSLHRQIRLWGRRLQRRIQPMSVKSFIRWKYVAPRLAGALLIALVVYFGLDPCLRRGGHCQRRSGARREG